MKSSSRSITYMPGLDGLRAFAVLSVILYHLSVSFFSGGFLGVDLFFVLSGYLITGLLLREWQTTGRLDLKRFWIHRFRRLFPALFVMLLLVLGYVTVFERDLLHTVRQDSAFALIYGTNWWYIFHDVSYFESFGKPSPIQNLWSLAIEEQFYLLFPILLWLGMKNRRLFLQLIGVAIGASVLAMAIQFTPGEDPSRVYYGTDTRLFALLIGSLLAFAWQPTRFKIDIPKRGVRLLNQTGAVTLPLLLLLMVVTSEFGSFLYRGGFFIVSLLAALLIATIAHPASIWSRWFARPSLIAIGKRSYGLYLWHFPVITLLTPVEQIGTFSVLRTILIIVILVALTEASYRFIVRPIRQLGLSGYLKRLSLHPQQLRQFSTVQWASVAVLTILIVSFIGNLSILAVSDTPKPEPAFHKIAAPKEKPKPVL
ncbi:MAG TPA: acyltransferase, partial [Exiguobacterium sp.]|nr:acyltransferase [Exiguobacterium sp.]